MNTTVESLQALYVKLGGSIEDVADKTTIPEMLDAITLISGTDKPEIDGISINGGAVVTPDENGIIDLTIGDGSTAIDPELSPTSTNPVQNKIVTGEINSLNESVTALNGSLDYLKSATIDEAFTLLSWIDGFYLLYDKGKAVESADYSYTMVDVAGYSTISINTHMYSRSPCVCFYDTDGNYLNGVRNTNQTDGGYKYSAVLEVPKDATTLGISCITNYKSDVRVYSNIQEQINDIKAMGVDKDVQPNFSTTHKALVCAMNQKDYTVNIVDSLNKHGYSVSITTEDKFAEHVDAWMRTFDILVIGNERGIIPITVKHTPQEVGTAISKWVNAGKGIIFYMLYGQNVLSKLKANCAVQTYNLRQVIGDITVTKASVSSGEMAHGSGYPSWLGEMIDSRFIDCSPFVSSLSADGFEPLLTVTADGTVYTPVIVKNKIAVIGQCGEGNTTASGYWRYLDIGVVADMFVGCDEPKMAFDLESSKRLCAVSVDGDVTNDLVASQALIDGWDGCKLEFGLVTDKLTDSIVDFYRSQRTDVSYLSHTKTHLTANQTKTESFVLSGDCYVFLPGAWFLGDDNYINISVEDSDGNSISVVKYITSISESKCYFDASLGMVMFSTALAGKTVSITYTVIDDKSEWIMSEDIMQDTGLPDNKGVFLTAARYSMSAQTLYSSIKKGYILCDHIPQVGRMYAVTRSGLLDLVTPLTMPTWYNPLTHVLFDGESYGTTKAYAVSNIIPNTIQRCVNNNQGIMWYTHDFTVAENDERSIYASGGRWNADWKKATYEDTLNNVKDYWSSVRSAVNAIPHVWVTRSDYSRRYTRLNEGVQYYTEDINGVQNLFVQNVGTEKIKGLTFRFKTENQPIIESDHDVSYSYDETNHVSYLWFDIYPGQVARVKYLM